MADSERFCAWCRGPIRPAARRDSITCSTSCRQARNRFVQGVGTPPPVDGGHPLRLAYADPPYPGRSRKYYGDHPDYAGEVDHAALITSLAADYDGWALSTSADALPALLPLCPRGVRVAAWHRGERPNRMARGPQNAWEPVLFTGGRLRVAAAGNDDTSRLTAVGGDASLRSSTTAADILEAATAADVRDAETARHLVGATGSGDPHDGSICSSSTGDASGVLPRRIDSLIYRPGNRTTDPARVVGAKPAVFVRWIFDLLGALPGDEFVDIFPGSGGVSRAWRLYCGEVA